MSYVHITVQIFLDLIFVLMFHVQRRVPLSCQTAKQNNDIICSAGNTDDETLKQQI